MNCLLPSVSREQHGNSARRIYIAFIFQRAEVMAIFLVKDPELGVKSLDLDSLILKSRMD